MINENHKDSQNDANPEPSLPRFMCTGAIICLTGAHLQLSLSQLDLEVF